METQRNPNEPIKPKATGQEGGQQGGQQGGGSQERDRNKERDRDKQGGGSQERDREKQGGGRQQGGGSQERGGQEGDGRPVRKAVRHATAVSKGRLKRQPVKKSPGLSREKAAGGDYASKLRERQ